MSQSTPPPAISAPDPSPPRVSSGFHRRVPASELSERLTPLEFAVTQYAVTERPFQNTYCDHKEPGIYVDVVTGAPLFSSRDKFDSGTGWPSFTRPIEPTCVVEHEDRTYGMVRTQVLSAGGGSHLGYIFPDGPPPGGRRYCVNSAALRFIPASRLVAQGYGEYAGPFDGSSALDAPPGATSPGAALIAADVVQAIDPPQPRKPPRP